MYLLVHCGAWGIRFWPSFCCDKAVVDLSCPAADTWFWSTEPFCFYVQMRLINEVELSLAHPFPSDYKPVVDYESHDHKIQTVGILTFKLLLLPLGWELLLFAIWWQTTLETSGLLGGYCVYARCQCCCGLRLCSRSRVLQQHAYIMWCVRPTKRR